MKFKITTIIVTMAISSLLFPMYHENNAKFTEVTQDDQETKVVGQLASETRQFSASANRKGRRR